MSDLASSANKFSFYLFFCLLSLNCMAVVVVVVVIDK